MKIWKNLFLVVVSSGLLLLVISGCNAAEKQIFGKAIDPKAPKVTLSELLAKPEAYEGKDVVVDGLFAGNCGDGDFFFKDKFDIIEADPPDPKVANLKKGTPIRLYGLVKVHRTEAQEEKEGEEQESEKPQPTVKIVGKGVEVLEKK